MKKIKIRPMYLKRGYNSKRNDTFSHQLIQEAKSKSSVSVQLKDQDKLNFHRTKLLHGIQLEIDHALNREGLLTKIEKTRTHSILIAVYNLHFIKQFPVDHILLLVQQRYNITSLFNYRLIFSSPQSLLDYAISAQRSQEENNLEKLHKYLSNEVISHKISCLPASRCAWELCTVTNKIVGYKIYPIK